MTGALHLPSSVWCGQMSSGRAHHIGRWNARKENETAFTRQAHKVPPRQREQGAGFDFPTYRTLLCFTIKLQQSKTTEQLISARSLLSSTSSSAGNEEQTDMAQACARAR